MIMIREIATLQLHFSRPNITQFDPMFHYIITETGS